MKVALNIFKKKNTACGARAHTHTYIYTYIHIYMRMCTHIHRDSSSLFKNIENIAAIMPRSLGCTIHFAIATVEPETLDMGKGCSQPFPLPPTDRGGSRRVVRVCCLEAIYSAQSS